MKFRAVTKKRANNFRGLLFAAPGILRQKEVASLHRQASGLPVTKVQGWWWWWWWRDSKFPPTQYLGIAVRYPAHLCRPTTGAACNAIALLIADSQDHHHATRAILDRATGVTCQVDTANRTATDWLRTTAVSHRYCIFELSHCYLLSLISSHSCQAKTMFHNSL